MMRRGLLAASMTVGLVACGVGPDADGTAINSAELNFAPKIFSPPARDCRMVSARPIGTGTIRSAPNMGMLEVAPVGASVQSMFFETTNYGAETRRGVAEFDVPALSGRLVKAQLRFNDVHGYTFQPMAADWHTLSIYTADGAVTADDFFREGRAISTFATNMNTLNPATRDFDLTGSVAIGAHVGFRIELQRTPTQAGSVGSGFDQFQLDLTVCNEAALPGGAPRTDPSGSR